MSFNKRYLPSLDRLKEIREKSENDEDFIKSVVGNSDTLFGSSDSIDYINSIKENLIKNKKDGLGS